MRLSKENIEARTKRKTHDNVEQLRELVKAKDSTFRDLFLEMFADLPLYKQKEYLLRAEAMLNEDHQRQTKNAV